MSALTRLSAVLLVPLLLSGCAVGTWLMNAASNNHVVTGRSTTAIPLYCPPAR